jgi:hypothetical protein
MNADYKRCVRCGHRFMPVKAWPRRCWPCFRADAPRFRASTKPAVNTLVPILDSKTLRETISLTYPDRHAGRVEQATRVTQTLAVALARTREIEARA